MPSSSSGACYDEHRIEIPVAPWGDVPRLRISVQGYNTRADIERLLEAMEQPAPPHSEPRIEQRNPAHVNDP